MATAVENLLLALVAGAALWQHTGSPWLGVAAAAALVVVGNAGR